MSKQRNARATRGWKNEAEIANVKLQESQRLGQEHKNRELANAKKCNEYYEQIKKLKKQHDSLKAKADSQPALLEACEKIRIFVEGDNEGDNIDAIDNIAKAAIIAAAKEKE